MKWKLVIAAVATAALGAVVGAIWVGNSMYERTVVPDPYETGLHHDAELRKARELGWTIRVDEGALHVGDRVRLHLSVAGRDGRPLEGAEVAIRVSRAGRPALDQVARATPQGGGSFAAEVALTEAGYWDLDATVRRGGDAVTFDRRFQVAPAARVSGAAPAPAQAGTATAPCDAGRAPCSADADGLRVTLELSPRPPVPLRELAASVQVTRGGAPLEGATVSIELSMPGMFMGENRIALVPAPGGWAGKGALVRCASGRRDWVAEVVVRPAGGAEARVKFPFQAAE